MDLLKRFRKRLIVLFIICVVAGVGVMKKEAATVPVSATVLNLQTVVIDPGHGGFDGGAGAADGTLEKDINLDIALKVRDHLALAGFNTVMTRTEDTGTEDNSENSISSRKKSDLKNRLSLMENDGNTVYVSIHLNKFTTSAASGTQVFYTPNFSEAKLLGECIQAEVVKYLQPENKRVIKRGNDSTYLLKNATVPAVIVECGFLSNGGDLQKLKCEDYRKSLAFCISAGVMKFYKTEQ